MKSMKKLFAVSLMASLASLAFSFDITFTSVTGKVEFLDGSQWVKAREGDVIEQGTVVSTGYRSKATLKSKSAVFEIGPMTRITLEDLKTSNGKESTQLFLDSGSIQTEVEKGNKFKVRSAVATASVRGTRFRKTCSGRLGVGGGIVDFGPAESLFAQVSKIMDAAAQAQKAMAAANAESEPANADGATGNAEGGIANADGATGNAEGGNENNANPPAKTSVFTASDSIGDVKGIPVYANQQSTMDTFADRGTRPEEEKSSGTNLSFTGGALSSDEAVSSAPVTEQTTKTQTVTPQTASVVIELSFEN
ncbi:MAG: FecR domain-containing protein [Treponema sp.]|nr:FecR domain-containing protein [Treponema sp.]